MLILEIALGIAFGIALIPFAFRAVAWAEQLWWRIRCAPSRIRYALWVAAYHPATWVGGVLFLAECLRVWMGVPIH